MSNKTVTAGAEGGPFLCARSHMFRMWRRIVPVVLFAIALLAHPATAERLTIETDHFLIHFDDELEELALRAAVIAEEVHDELVPRVGHIPEQKTHLVLSDETDIANGFADPFLYPKITIFPVSPTFFAPYGSGISPRMTDWLRLVILHEYAHILHLDINEGMGKTVQKFFGRVPFITNMMILQGAAFIEGFATYEETVANLGGRGHDPYYRMFLRTMVLEDDFLRLDEILAHYPLERWKPGAAAYLYGYSMWDFMAKQYGQAALERFNKAFVQNASLDAAFANGLGTSADEFYEQWRAYVRNRFADEIASLQARGTTTTHPLGGYGYVPESPTASPDGHALAYATINGPVAPALRLIQWEDGAMQDRQLVAGMIFGPVAWSPDGKGLYYAKAETEATGTWTDIYRYDVNTGQEQRLTRGLRAMGPVPSPDGRRLVFTSRDKLVTRLLELDLEKIDALPVRAGSPHVREVLPATGDTQRIATDWFPDGESLLVASHEPGGGMDLLRVNPASGEALPLVIGSRARGGDGIVNQNARFTPDGRFILFDSDRTGIYNLYAYDVSTGETLMVARTLTGLFAPTLLTTAFGPRLVAMEYTAAGYRLSMLPYAPDEWEQASARTGVNGDTPIVRIHAVDAPTIRISSPWQHTDNRVEGTLVRVRPAEGPAGEGDGSVQTKPGVRPLIGPYHPLRALRPRYALPTFAKDESGPIIGVMTEGYDPFHEHAYNVEAGLGVTSGRPVVELQYAGPVGNSKQTGWSLHALQRTQVDDSAPSGTLMRGLSLGASHSWPATFSNVTLWAQTDFWQEQRVHKIGPAEAPHPGQAASAGLSYRRVRPVDDRNTVADSRFTVTGLREGADWHRRGYVATVQEERQFSWDLRRQILSRTLVLGTSDLEDGFTVGETSARAGTQTDWSLNSPGPKLVGRHGARFEISYNRQLHRIGRGFDVFPLFVDDIGMRIYAEGGAAWTDLSRAPQGRWGVGAEASITSYVGFVAPVTVAVGAAVNLEEADRPSRFYVRFTLDDALGGAARR